MVVLDLFSGAGGLSEGFFRQGATFVGHVEVDNYACQTLKTRKAYWKLRKQNKLDIYYDYLLNKISNTELLRLANIDEEHEIINKAISEDTMNDIYKNISINIKRNKVKKIDVIIGGPPCQAYSIVGRARMKESVKNDHRNFLYKFYVQFLEKYKPKIFVFENVPGLKTAGNGEYYRHLQIALENAGYHLEEQEMVASDYGVLQTRKRIIIVGIRKRKNQKNFPKVIFSKIILDKDITVNDVLRDLPFTLPGNKIEGENLYVENTNKYLELSHIREKDFNILTQHETRPHNDRDREIYQEAIIAWDERKERLCYSELSRRRPDLCTHKNKTTFTNRFNVIKSDQKASHTILAHMAMDGHYYIHPDIKQLRSLSIREAARLQSFPDDFYFEGPRTSIFRQIGNAVPPKMAEQIAKKITDLL
ncbi:DNA cytosine methyltransferase [Sulfurospirillum sp. 1612]|uniref:DNA cytosine methyltransferase n=1 Tax=Sulfurospirillum sp. 1612 TaxID=3094835 RepID=UPI002F938382